MISIDAILRISHSAQHSVPSGVERSLRLVVRESSSKNGSISSVVGLLSGRVLVGLLASAISVVVVVVVGMVRVVIGGVVIVPEDSVVALLVSGVVDLAVVSFSDADTQAELSTTMISNPVRYLAYFVLDTSYPPYLTMHDRDHVGEPRIF